MAFTFVLNIFFLVFNYSYACTNIFNMFFISNLESYYIEVNTVVYLDAKFLIFNYLLI